MHTNVALSSRFALTRSDSCTLLHLRLRLRLRHARLAVLSRAAPALHLAIPVQMPFHTIEDRLFERMKREKERAGMVAAT